MGIHIHLDKSRTVGSYPNVSTTVTTHTDQEEVARMMSKYNLLANPHIKISSNKGTSSNPVFDLVADPSSISFVQGLGMAAGAGLKDKESVRRCVIRLWDLSPRDVVEEAKRGHGSGVTI